MRYPVTIDSVNRFMRLLGHEWRGEWQHEMLDALVNYPEVVIQAARQVAGKTFTVGIFEAARILAGNTVTIGYPTMAQSSRLLGERITGNVNTINKLLSDATGHKLFRQPREQVAYQRWQLLDDPTHEGKLYSLSANEIAIHKPEGYTTDDLDLDEAHRQTEKTLGIFEPFTDVAAEQGNARIIYIGVGGHKQSLIEQKKLKSGVKVVRWPASRIMSVTSKWDKVFEQRRASLPPWQWRQHYECEQSVEGKHLMYPEPMKDINFQEYINRGMKGLHYFGIDVGRIKDATIVTGALRYGDRMKIIDYLEVPRISFPEQARMIYEWIDRKYYYTPDRVSIELNGLGHGLYDILNVPGYFPGLYGVTTDENMKVRVWEESAKAIQDGQLAVVHPYLLGIFEGMEYEAKVKDGKFIIEHSDEWMSFAMLWYNAGQE